MDRGSGQPKAYGITAFHQKEALQGSQPRADKTTSFHGSHLFIHHDAKHMRARPHRATVFSHVQGRYRPWKRRESAKALRGSSSIAESDEDSLPPSPTTLLAEGNSDPFMALPVKIGPAENDLIAFYRDVAIPAKYELVFKIPGVSKLRKVDWEDCRYSLQNDGVAHGTLARYGQMLSTQTSAFRKITMEHQHRSTQMLLKKLQHGQVGQDFDSYLHINMLFSAETLCRNLSGALAHGNMLRHMFEQAWKAGTLDYKLILYQLYNDCQVSSMFLVRPIWDVHSWLPMIFAPIWAAATPHLPVLDDTKDHIDPSIHGELATHFKGIREVWETLAKREQVTPESSANPAFTGWVLSKGYIHHGRIINHYLDLTQPLRSPSLPKRVRNELITQQFLALAAVYHLKVLSRDPILLGVPVFDARKAILPALRAGIDESSRLCKDTKEHWNVNARLWALYVGAMAEQRFPGPDVDPHEQWFNSHLAEQAISMRLRTWEEVQKILVGFLYFDRIPPNGSEWFEESLRLQKEKLAREKTFAASTSQPPAKVPIPRLKSQHAKQPILIPQGLG